MKLELKNYRGTEDDFNKLSLLEKRAYIIQTEQEDTMWYQRTVAKIQYASYLLGIVLGILFIIFKASSH